MLEAIVSRLGEKTDLSAAPTLLEYKVRAQLGLYQTLHVHRFPRLSASLGGLAPDKVKRRFGVVADRDITGVLDASGFAYSDSFGVRRSQREALYGRRWDKRGVPKVMLPQAYGPFRDAAVAQWAEQVLNQAQIVFVRDPVSEQHLRNLTLRVRVKRAPDFTIGLAPIKIAVPSHGDYVAIVPNMKLITQGIVREDRYIERLVSLGASAMSLGLSPLLIVHESADRQIAQSIATRLSAPVFEDPRPLALKGAIAGSSLLISSRFHAVVGGLSQSVKTIALGWSHKYKALLDDFNVPDWLGGLDGDPNRIVRSVVNDDVGAARLHDAKLHLLHNVEEMWKLTEHALNVAPGRQTLSDGLPS